MDDYYLMVPYLDLERIVDRERLLPSMIGHKKV